MLSKIALLVLGLIAEKPLNPYEIQKFIDSINFKKMYPMSTSSIYATINTLLKKEFITGKKEKVGKMPEKTIYSITEKGTITLQRSLDSYLANSENIFSEFDVSMIFICHLEKEKALQALNRHQKRIEEIIAENETTVKHMEQTKSLPYTGLIRRKHHITKRKAELGTIKELKANIKKDPDWNHYPVIEWDI